MSDSFAPWYYPPNGWSTRSPKLDLNSSLDVTATSGSNAFYSVTANWTAGQVLVVRGAGASSTAVYVSTITSVQPNTVGSTAIAAANAGTSGTGLQAFWGTDDTVAWQTALLNQAPGTTLDGPPNFSTLIQQRIDTGCSWANNGSFMTDPSITAADKGKWVTTHAVSVTGTGPDAFTGVPFGTFVGAVTPGVGFTMVNQQGVPVTATAAASSQSICIGGLFIPSFVQLCPEVQNRQLFPEVSFTVPGIFTSISQNIRSNGRLFGIIQCASLTAGDGTANGSQIYSPPNPCFGLTTASGIGGPMIYSLNQVPYNATTATAFGPTIGVAVASAAGWYIGSPYIPNAYIAIALQGGPGRVANPVTGALSIDMIIDHCYDYVKIDSLTCGVWWDYVEAIRFGTSTTGLDLFAFNNRNFLVLGRVDAMHMNTLNGVIGNGGVFMPGSADTQLTVIGSYGTIDKCDIDQACASAVKAGNNQVTFFIGTLTAGGNVQAFGPSSSGVVPVQTTTANGKLKIASWALRSYSATNSSTFASSSLLVPGTNPG